MLRWAIAVLLLLGALVYFAPTLARRRGEPKLGAALEQATDFVNTTVATVASDLPATPAPNNADPEQARELHNNHSFGDHSNPRYPGYNDCDSWKNIIFDGWNGIYRVELTLPDDQHGDALVAATRRYWEELGLSVESSRGEGLFTEATRLHVHVDHVGYSLYVDPTHEQAALTAWTDCLPPR